jgi:FlaA1/EpsC-like NDP-sugar epimerase
MVTGAGGSIGGELCRQIARFHPSQLILLDMAETSLFWSEMSLKEEFPDLSVLSFLADIKDAARLEQIISEVRPEIIYHAAAYKHVPIVEKNVVEGIKNNIFGTYNLVLLADKYRVNNFVLISTDKAVNPQSFMGISKRINEIVIQSLTKESDTKFVSVRFGNVLDSSGSCLPVFKKQIRENLPITITHPDAKRFFMTLPEAGQLILQAGAMGKGGEIFILKMGEPIKIIELAKELVTLSGSDSNEVKFSFIGLRPGEKLEEELIGKNEKVQLTHDEKILIVQSDNHVSYSELKEELNEIHRCVESQNIALAIEKCKSIVNKYS